VDELLPTRNAEVVPERVLSLLLWARDQEDAAAGPSRRPAQRFTREIISGILDIGYPSGTVAQCLGITTSSLRSRVQPGGWLPARKVERGSRLRAGTLRRWQAEGLLPEGQIGLDGDIAYPAVAVVRALILAAQAKPQSPQP
jgi:hypothetical protein